MLRSCRDADLNCGCPPLQTGTTSIAIFALRHTACFYNKKGFCYLQNKSGEDIKNYNDCEEVEGDEVETDPAAAGGQHESLCDDVPLVDHQQLEEDHEGAAQVAKVVGAVAVLSRPGFFFQTSYN